MNIYVVLIINSFLSTIGTGFGLTIFEIYIKPKLIKHKRVKNG